MSKNFKKEEIIGYMIINGKRVTYLKPGVKRVRRYYGEIDENIMDHLNYNLINIKRWQEYAKKVLGIDDFEEFNSTQSVVNN